MIGRGELCLKILSVIVNDECSFGQFKAGLHFLSCHSLISFFLNDISLSPILC
jgi:hypothetical protein